MMEEKRQLRVLLASADEAFLQRMLLLMGTDNQLALAGMAVDGESAVELFCQNRAELVVLDTELPLIDGLTAASRLRKLSKEVGILLMSTFTGAQVRAECELLHIDYMMRKPVRAEALYERLLLWAQAAAQRKSAKESAGFERRLGKLLQEFGVPLPDRGRKYLVDAISLSAAQHNGVTKGIYPEMAKKYETSQKNVERVLRYSVHKIWTKCKPDVLAVYFGETCVFGQDSIGNGAFCSTLADYLRLEAKDD